MTNRHVSFLQKRSITPNLNTSARIRFLSRERRRPVLGPSKQMEQHDDGGDSRLVSAPEVSSDTEMVAAGDDDADGDAGDQEETSKFTRLKPLPIQWTDEKHNLYLESIEASFVDQLYNSMGFPGFEPPRKASHEAKPHLRCSIRTSGGQFKTLRGGHWHKINVGKGEQQPDGQNASHGLLSNQWIRHYRHSERHHRLETTVCHGKAAAVDQEINSKGKAALPCKFTRSLKISNEVPSNLQCPVFAGNDTAPSEASGQNFVNEDLVEEKPGILCSAKAVRTQTPVNDSSSKDQIVP